MSFLQIGLDGPPNRGRIENKSTVFVNNKTFFATRGGIVVGERQAAWMGKLDEWLLLARGEKHAVSFRPLATGGGGFRDRTNGWIMLGCVGNSSFAVLGSTKRSKRRGTRGGTCKNMTAPAFVRAGPRLPPREKTCPLWYTQEECIPPSSSRCDRDIFSA